MLKPALAAVALAGSIACGSMPRAPIGAPKDSYTPRNFVVEVAGQSSTVAGAEVTPRFFTTERVNPMLGRFFVAEDYTSGSSRVVLISHAFWRNRLDGNPAVIGSLLAVDGQRRTIVGIAPPQFQPDNGGLVWIPGGS